MATREYAQGVATLGFDGGPQVVFRLNPNEVHWNFQVNTNVTETLGGRVVQVLGATLSDMTITGSFGELRGTTHTESKVLAERFLVAMKDIANTQASDATAHGAKMHQPAVFSFPTKNWKFRVYVKDLTDSQGGMAIVHQTGKFSYDYVLTLMIHADLSDTSKILGSSNGVLANIKNKAIQDYMDRIYDGIGWSFKEYNGHGSYLLDQGPQMTVPPSAMAAGGVGAKDNTPHDSASSPAGSPSSSANPNKTDLIAFGNWLIAKGFNVGEHPSFGGFSPVHVKGSWHYKGGAIDVNWPNDSTEKSKINSIVVPEAKKRGFRLIWQTNQYGNHYNHIHVDISTGPNIGNV